MAEISESLRQKIETIPGDDGWFHDSQGLLKIAENEVFDILLESYFAVANEFGS